MSQASLPGPAPRGDGAAPGQVLGKQTWPAPRVLRAGGQEGLGWEGRPGRLPGGGTDQRVLWVRLSQPVDERAWGQRDPLRPRPGGRRAPAFWEPRGSVCVCLCGQGQQDQGAGRGDGPQLPGSVGPRVGAQGSARAGPAGGIGCHAQGFTGGPGRLPGRGDPAQAWVRGSNGGSRGGSGRALGLAVSGSPRGGYAPKTEDSKASSEGLPAALALGDSLPTARSPAGVCCAHCGCFLPRGGPCESLALQCELAHPSGLRGHSPSAAPAHGLAGLVKAGRVPARSENVRGLQGAGLTAWRGRGWSSLGGVGGVRAAPEDPVASGLSEVGAWRALSPLAVAPVARGRPGQASARGGGPAQGPHWDSRCTVRAGQSGQPLGPLQAPEEDGGGRGGAAQAWPSQSHPPGTWKLGAERNRGGGGGRQQAGGRCRGGGCRSAPGLAAGAWARALACGREVEPAGLGLPRELWSSGGRALPSERWSEGRRPPQPPHMQREAPALTPRPPVLLLLEGAVAPAASPTLDQ